MNNQQNQTRREFVAKSTLATAGISIGINALASVKTKRVFGANDKIRMGFIGVGNRGSQLLHLFMKNKDIEVTALCDVYEPYMLRDRSKVDPRYIKDLGGRIPNLG